jgi:hypothetical protein
MSKITRLCVYCGSSAGRAPAYREAARELGRLLAENGIELIYGGGRVGLMGLVADAALAAGGRVVGIIPDFLRSREVGHSSVSELIVVASMHERKQRMFERADAFAVLPGGIGTLEEALECITWKQLGLHDKPIVIVATDGYWEPLAALFDHIVGAGFAPADTRALVEVVRTPQAALAALEAAPESRLAAAIRRV